MENTHKEKVELCI